MSGKRVCIAGVTDEGKSIRPEFKSGSIHEHWLFEGDEAIVRPFARLQFDLIRHKPEPPHTEDWVIDDSFRGNAGLPPLADQVKLLERILDANIAGIFGAQIHKTPGFYVNKGEGNRSLGTIKVQKLWEVVHDCGHGRWEYRINFVDASNTTYRLGVTDLAFRYYMDHLREKEGLDCEQVGKQLSNRLRTRELYLRIGLARPTWEKYPDRCFLQVNGVYSFPDYLDGKSFADFSPGENILV